MFSRIIKILLIDKQLKQKELAEKLNTSRTNLTDKIRRDNFSEKDMQSIADALNCELVIKLIDKETGQEYQYEYSVIDVSCQKVFWWWIQI